MKKRLLAGLLALCMLFGLMGCKSRPANQEATKPTATQPVVPQAVQVYNRAVGRLKETGAVTFSVMKKTTVTAEGAQFKDEAAQVLSYAELNTDAPIVRLEEQVPYESDSGTTAKYVELYAHGTLYAELEGKAAFCGDLSKEAAATRYAPVGLLDAALYGSVTMEKTADETRVSFGEPVAAESWAAPADSQLVEAAGTATLDQNGTLQNMTYTLTYRVGTVSTTVEVTSTPRQKAETVTVPAEKDKYVRLQCIEALRIVIDSKALTKDGDALATISSEQFVSQAAGYAFSQSRSTYTHQTTGGKLLGMAEAQLQEMTVQGTQKLEQKEEYRDGKITVTVDDQPPTTQSGITQAEARKYFDTLLMMYLVAPEYWKDVTATDLGGVLLLEFTYTDAFGQFNQDTICQMLWQDADFLSKLASQYKNTKLSGYLAVDMATGLLTAAGYSYEGVHTIEGTDYILTSQADQSIRTSGYEIYHEITDQYLEEQEPEKKPTPLFYKVTGKNGQEMWLLGTIHIGDERTGYMPKEIKDALAASDALALEVDAEKFEAQMETDEEMQKKMAAAYFYNDGSMTEDHLDSALYRKALQLLKASGNYFPNVLYMKPSLWESSISSFLLRMGHSLRSEQGVENRLTELAKQHNVPVREVESGLFQMEMTTGWSEKLQELLLEATLEETVASYLEEAVELYELWCAGDEKALREALNRDTDPSLMTPEELEEYNKYLPQMEEYNKTMQFDRNANMLKVAKGYLESGETVFYAVGLAHLLDSENGLVDALRDAGYTVELVKYA